MIPPPSFRRGDPNAPAGAPRAQDLEQRARLAHAFEPVGPAAPAAAAAAASVSPAVRSVRGTLAATCGFNSRLVGGVALVGPEPRRLLARALGGAVLLHNLDRPDEPPTLLRAPPPAAQQQSHAAGGVAAAGRGGGGGGGVAPGARERLELSAFTASPSGRLLAVACGPLGGRAGPADVLVWDVCARPPKLQARLQHHAAGVRSLSFSPDERWLLSCGDDADRRLLVFDLLPCEQGQPAGLVCSASGAGVLRCAFGPRVRDATSGALQPRYLLAAATHERVEFLELDVQRGSATPQGRCSLGATKRVFHCLEFSPDGKLLFGGTASGDVCVVLVSQRALVHTISSVASAAGAVGAVAFRPDGRVLVGRRDGSLTSYEMKHAGTREATWLDVAQTRVPGGVSSFAQAYGFQGAVIVGTIEGALYELNDLASSSQQQRGGGGTPPRRLEQAHVGAVLDMSVSEARGVFATASADGSVQVRRLDSAAMLRDTQCIGGPLLLSAGDGGGGGVGAAEGRQATCCALAPDADSVLVGYANGALRSFATADGREQWSLPAAHRAVSCVAVAASGRFLVSAGAGGEVRCWAPSTRALLTELKEHTAPVSGLVPLAPADPRRWVSVSTDRRLCELDLAQPRLQSLHEAKSGGLRAVVRWEARDLLLTIGADNGLSVWRLASAAPIHTAPALHGPGGEPMSLAINAAGNLVATGDESGKIFLHALGAEGAAGTIQLRTLATLEGHTGCVRKLAFVGRDGLLSVGDDEAILRWKLHIE